MLKCCRFKCSVTWSSAFSAEETSLFQKNNHIISDIDKIYRTVCHLLMLMSLQWHRFQLTNYFKGKGGRRKKSMEQVFWLLFCMKGPSL